LPVFHLDIEAFLTAVERVRDPALVKRPLVIALPFDRATVIAASPEAKALGVRRDMPLSRVRRDLPDIRVIAPDYTLYDRANRAVLDVVNRFTPIVEPVSYGHIAMDMTGMRGLYGTLSNAAVRLCDEIRTRTVLDATVGIADNKLVSTIAAKEIQKNDEPLCEVPREGEPGFLAPLTCKALPEWEDAGVRRLLFELNLRHISQIQAISRDIFSFALGKAGTALHRHAMGIDPQPVTPPDRTPRLRERHRFVPDTNDDAVIRAAVYSLVERLCAAMRAKSMTARAASLHLSYSDDVARMGRFRFAPTQEERAVYQALMGRYARLCDRRRRVAHVALVLEGLCVSNEAQPSLFDQPAPTRLAPGLDEIRRRFGNDAVRVGRTLRAG